MLPVVTLAIPIAGFLSQVSRDALDEADGSPFAVTARSRGAGEIRVLLSHTLRHASLPAISLSGWAFGNLLSGAVVVGQRSGTSAQSPFATSCGTPRSFGSRVSECPPSSMTTISHR